MQKGICQKFGERIIALRKKQGLTQDQLAEKAGISTKYLQNLEGKNPKNPSLITLNKIACGFGMPLWKLLKS